jgi:hypothetical protein
MPFDSSNFGYRTLPSWLQDFVAGMGPSTMSNLRQGFQQETVRPGVRINFDREFANRNSSLSEVLSQVFATPGQNALVPGRIFNPIQQNNPEPPIPPLLPIPPDAPTSPPPSGGSGGSGGSGSGGSGSGSAPTSFCSGSGPFSSICGAACLDINGDSSCSTFPPPMGTTDPFNTPVCPSVRFDTSTTPPTAVPLCGCSSWTVRAYYYSGNVIDCFNGMIRVGPFAEGGLLQTTYGFCCYEGLGVIGHATLVPTFLPGDPPVYLQWSVVGEPDPLAIATFFRDVAEYYCPNGDCTDFVPGWISCNSPWEVSYADGWRDCPSPRIDLPVYDAFP